MDKQKKRQYDRKRYLQLRKKKLNDVKAYYKINRKKRLAYAKQYRITHAEKINEYSRNNHKKIMDTHCKYMYQRAKNDPQFKLIINMRNRVNKALKHDYKAGKTKNLIGCSIAELKLYLESKFKPGMTWKNHGKWHIDHIKPCCTFDLSKPEEQRKCFHYTNLQPLWAKENLEKRKYV